MYTFLCIPNDKWIQVKMIHTPHRKICWYTDMLRRSEGKKGEWKCIFWFQAIRGKKYENTIIRKTYFFTLYFVQQQKNKTKLKNVKAAHGWHTLTEKGEQKALWNGMERQLHICVRWKKKKNTDWRGNEKETDFKVPTAHGDRKWRGRGFDRVSLWVLTRLSVGLKTEVCVCTCGSRMHVCTVYVFPLAHKCACVRVDRGCWGKARCSRGSRHPAVCQSAGWKMTAIWIESAQHKSQRGRGWRGKCQSLH